MPPKKEQPKGLKDMAGLSFGYTSAAGFFLCFGLGYWADQKFQTDLRWTMAGLAAGISLIIYELWKMIKK